VRASLIVLAHQIKTFNPFLHQSRHPHHPLTTPSTPLCTARPKSSVVSSHPFLPHVQCEGRNIHTLGSRLIAIVKCLIAVVLSRIVLYSRPSMKCTFASSGAMSLSTCSSANASRGCRRLIRARAFLNRDSAERGSSSHARLY
jgi:hypothetical protein